MQHRARKRFGQNFLVDARVVERIIDAVAPAPGQLLFEIGPGRQALTAPLAASGADLVVVEIDRDLAARLEGGGPYRVINQDALTLDFAALADGRPYRLVGNLPYNISTPLLFHILAQRPPPVDMHFMLQREVVERVVAEPGSKRYGRLSLMCQNLCEAWPVLEVGPEAFEPRPRVDSTVVRLAPRAEPWVPPGLHSAFEAIVLQAFSMRRKTLRNSLKGLFEAQDFIAAEVDPSTRPEQLDLDAFSRLARIHAG